MRLELSADLLELVVDELAGEKPALSACALASSVLRRRARHHLFWAIEITSLARATTLAEFLDADPALGASVASLHAWVGPPTGRDAWLGAPGRTGLCALLQRFPNLTTLELSSVDFVAFNCESGVGALTAALPVSLRRLVFYACELASDTDLIALITAAPRLRSLTLHSCEWPRSTALPEGEAHAPAIQLEVLQLISLWGSTEVDRPWLTVVSTTQLVSLMVTLYGASDVPFWQAQIDQAPAMRKLVLMNYNQSAMNLNLSSLKTLRELIVASEQLPSFDGAQGPDLSLPLLRALETVSSPYLERATFMVEFPTPELLVAINWFTLRAVCEAVRARSPQLRVVLGLHYNARRASDDTDNRLVECERIVGEAIVTHEMEKTVSVQRMRINWRE